MKIALTRTGREAMLNIWLANIAEKQHSVYHIEQQTNTNSAMYQSFHHICQHMHAQQQSLSPSTSHVTERRR
jgi:hypothetical protein